MINAGDLDKRVIIQYPALSRDSYGAETQTWTDLVTVWAGIITDSGREFFAAQKINSEVTAVIKIRYRADIKTTMRIKYGNRFFDILFVNDVNQGHEELQLLCKEII